jgi:CRISPR-associated protein Cmr6
MDIKTALGKAFSDKGIQIEDPDVINRTTEFQPRIIDPEEVRMMYRAQINQRCSLQNASKTTHLERWVEEWTQSNSGDQPKYQYKLPTLGLDGAMYRFSVCVSGRLSTNSGQDMIIRPVIDVYGIPLIPGSAIKGLFVRWMKKKLLNNENEGIAKKIRFHRAYPIGNWTNRMVDVVHPQYEAQVGMKPMSPHAFANITLYQPTLIFELSSQKPLAVQKWQEVEQWILSAVAAGIGGKTSTGYGLIGQPPLDHDRYNLVIPLIGTGVSSLLRSDVPEFRPNQFKATMRGHVYRLLGGSCSDENIIRQHIDFLFGNNKAIGKLNLYWDNQEEVELKESLKTHEKTPICRVQGQLMASLPTQYLDWLQSVFRFAYIMGGFGKSWRRTWHRGDLSTWHKGFFPSYQQRAIGCHWECTDQDLIGIQKIEDLEQFLFKIDHQTQSVVKSQNKDNYMNEWREAWHPKNVQVYAIETTTSQAIHLFHNEIFKFTPAVGGRAIKQTPNGEKKDSRPTSMSSVWHRMLPIENGNYLEIVTVYKQGNWNHFKEENIRQRFLQQLTNSGLSKIWGS